MTTKQLFIYSGFVILALSFGIFLTADAYVFPEDSVTTSGYLNGGCIVWASESTSPVDGNDTPCFHGVDIDDFYSTVTIPDQSLPQTDITILATKLWFIVNGITVPTTGYASINCQQRADTFLNFLDAPSNVLMSDTALLTYKCPAGELYIQNAEPTDGALMMYTITYVPYYLDNSSTTTATSTASFSDDEQFVIMIAVFFMSLIGIGLLYSPFKAK